MKVKCVKCLRTERYFTPGKVYKVKHGKITNDRGYTYEEETNSEALEFLSGWYLFKKVKKDKIVKMREKLKKHCLGKTDCSGCKLNGAICRCGHGTHFMTKDNAGDYEMSNKEIKAAFNIVFGTGVREVKRRAKKGEYVKIVNTIASYGNYKNGDILKIVDDVDYVRYGYCDGQYLLDSEYVVLEGYKSEKQDNPKEPHKFKVGDIVKGNLESDDRYNITNSNMTRGKVTKVSEDGNYIDVEILEHKHGDTGNLCALESKYFDLVEEPPELYNGKIIFTKGDDTFKTGHIYEVNDGRVIAPAYGSLPLIEPFKDIEDVKDYFTGNLDGNRKREKGWSPYTLELMEVKED